MASVVSVVVWQFTAFLGCAVAVLFGACCIYLVHIHRKYAHLPSPKMDSFFLGHLPRIWRNQKSGIIFCESLLQYAQECGPTYVLFLLHETLVVTIDQDAVKDLLITGGHPKSAWAYASFSMLYGERFIGKGLVTETDHNVWARRRALMNPAFHRQFLKTLMDNFDEIANDLMTKLSTLADGKTIVSLSDNVHRATLDVIGKVAFGMDLNSINDPNSPFPRAIFKTFQGFSVVSKSVVSQYLPFLDRQFKNDVREACRFLRQTGRRCMEERKLAIERGEHVPTDNLTYILEAKEKDPSQSESEALDDFVTFFIAGQETTANVLSFLILELGRNPDILARARDEVDTVLSQRSNITFEDVNNLQYGSRLLKEALRLYPPVVFTFREIKTNHKVNGYMLPANTTILTSTYVSSRYEEYNTDPLTFDPDRFLPDSGRRPSIYTYFPFSLGPRSCIGMTFAKIEAKVILAKFLQRFNFDLDPQQSFDIDENTTLIPKGGTAAMLSLRE